MNDRRLAYQPIEQRQCTAAVWLAFIAGSMLGATIALMVV